MRDVYAGITILLHDIVQSTATNDIIIVPHTHLTDIYITSSRQHALTVCVCGMLFTASVSSDSMAASQHLKQLLLLLLLLLLLPLLACLQHLGNSLAPAAL